MRSVLVFTLIAAVTASLEVQLAYHDSVGIPLAAQIKAYEDGLAENPQDESRIVGGALAPAAAQPYFGGLLIPLVSGGTSVCGSSLISPTRAITAAHCWFDGTQQAIMFNVIFDSNSLFTGGTRIQTNHVVMHPQWTFWNLHNDVAMIYLPVWLPLSARIQPISIPAATEIHETFAGHWALATGFGRTQDTQQTAATELSRVTLQVINHNQCLAVFTSTFITPSTLCTNGFGGVGICGGDSGGPLVVNYNGRQVLIGVSSFVARDGCQLGFPSAFARVTSFRNFILQHM